MSGRAWTDQKSPDKPLLPSNVDAEFSREDGMRVSQRQWLLSASGYHQGEVNARRTRSLFKQAMKSAGSSRAATKKSENSSRAALGVHSTARRYAEAAHQAESSGNRLGWLGFCLYSRWLQVWVECHIGKSKQLMHRAEANLKKTTAVLDALGINRGA